MKRLTPAGKIGFILLMRRILSAFHIVTVAFSVVLMCSLPARALLPQGKARHVVVLIWDGMRPDCVNEHDTPALYRLMHEGTTFANHHAVFLSSTEVNGTALATGVAPQNSGVIANDEYRPDIELLRPIEMQSEWAVWKGDRVTHGQYIHAATLAEAVQRAGRSTAIAGTKGVVLLLDRASNDNEGGGARATLFEGKIIPAAMMDSIRPQFGPMPLKANPKKAANAGQDRWTTQVVVERLWSQQLPALTMLWLSEPDFAQHGSGPGSKVARAAIKSSDDNLARVLKALEDGHMRDKTDVLVVSDHGFSTISRAIDLAEMLTRAGIKASKELDAKPVRGDVMVVGHGGSASIYVGAHDGPTIARIVDFLQRNDVTGVVFTRQAMEGTFALEQAAIDSADAPDIVVSFRWSDAAASTTGLPGLVVCDSEKRQPGQGIHASLSRFDMHNTLIAAGPDFKKDFVDQLPTGNIDVAPTLFHILGLKPQNTLDGRVLSESLQGGEDPRGGAMTSMLETKREFPQGAWKQYLRVSIVGNTRYYDEGNGAMAEAGQSIKQPAQATAHP